MYGQRQDAHGFGQAALGAVILALTEDNHNLTLISRVIEQGSRAGGDSKPLYRVRTCGTHYKPMKSACRGWPHRHKTVAMNAATRA